MSHNHTHSHSCHSEHTGDDNGGHNHNHNHSHTDDLTPLHHSTLYQHIDHPQIQTLNESTPHSGRSIVSKPWESRLDPLPFLSSPPDDPQLLIHIPFTGQVKLHSILLRAAPDGTAPRKVKLYKNRLDLDFAMAGELAPTQVIELPRGVEGAGAGGEGEGVLEVGLKRALWTAVWSVTLFFVDNWAVRRVDGEDEDDDDDDDHDDEDDEENEEEVPTEISYLGFRGDWLRAGGAPLGVLYESAANPADHKLTHKNTRKGGIGMDSESPHGPL